MYTHPCKYTIILSLYTMKHAEEFWRIRLFQLFQFYISAHCITIFCTAMYHPYLLDFLLQEKKKLLLIDIFRVWCTLRETTSNVLWSTVELAPHWHLSRIVFSCTRLGFLSPISPSKKHTCKAKIWAVSWGVALAISKCSRRSERLISH